MRRACVSPVALLASTVALLGIVAAEAWPVVVQDEGEGSLPVPTLVGRRLTGASPCQPSPKPSPRPPKPSPRPPKPSPRPPRSPPPSAVDGPFTTYDLTGSLQPDSFGSASVVLPFPFRYFCNFYAAGTQVWVSARSLLTFDQSGSTQPSYPWEGYTSPNEKFPTGQIVALGNINADLSSSGQMSCTRYGRRTRLDGTIFPESLVCRWQDVHWPYHLPEQCYQCNQVKFTFEIWLLADNRIMIYYGDFGVEVGAIDMLIYGGLRPPFPLPSGVSAANADGPFISNLGENTCHAFTPSTANGCSTAQYAETTYSLPCEVAKGLARAPPPTPIPPLPFPWASRSEEQLFFEPYQYAENNPDQTAPVVLPFAFKFFCKSYSPLHMLYVSTGGFASFAQIPANLPYLGLEAPNPYTPGGIIAGFWSSLDLVNHHPDIPSAPVPSVWRTYLSADGFQSTTNIKTLVLSWRNVASGYDNAYQPFTFEVWIRSNGVIMLSFPAKLGCDSPVMGDYSGGVLPLMGVRPPYPATNGASKGSSVRPANFTTIGPTCYILRPQATSVCTTANYFTWEERPYRGCSNDIS